MCLDLVLEQNKIQTQKGSNEHLFILTYCVSVLK